MSRHESSHPPRREMSSPTGPALQALTTPFVPPPNCADQFTTTSIMSSYTSGTKSGDSVIPFLASDPADPRFSACQPSGWDWNLGSDFQFSPAVCPSGWTAYNLGGTVYQGQFTTAYCCSSGFTYTTIDGYRPGSPGEGISTEACFATMTDSPAAPTATTASSPGPSFRVHNAWHISWAATDISSLSPIPPSFSTCGVLPVIPSWAPGATVEPVKCHTPDEGGLPSGPGFMFVLIGLPVGGFLVLVAICWLCFRQCRRRRRALRAMKDKAVVMMPIDNGQSDVPQAVGKQGI
ncbi:hypothetical protein DL546_003840 [Coniochaeta pulveracea]|uniref:Uncharacterized protein n=1 Tax=Coniochaeta pulveracea TaxID=177199 RepID=A0A420Y1T7_9PEZI|nr:hypothetical protein DL546_003840 [Coniochaeta pulveracea]